MSSDPSVCSYLGYTEQLNAIASLMKSCAEERKGSSVYLVGPHGVGKTSLINAAWNSLAVKPHLIVLDGVLCHDGHVAVKVLAEALGIDLTAFQSRGITDDLVIVFDALRGGSHRSGDSQSGSRISESIEQRGVVLVLDTIDAFCMHRNQTFLYEVFECAMRSQAGAQRNVVPVCVIGTTSRSDAVELLEKRVRSRFSQRVVSMRCDDLTLDVYCELLVETLVHFLTSSSRTVDRNANRRKSSAAPNAADASKLEATVRSLVFENAEVKDEVKWLFSVSRDLRTLRKVAAYTSARHSVTATSVIDAIRRTAGCPLQDAISACNAVELGVLIAAQRVADRAALQRRNATRLRSRRGAPKRPLAEDEPDALECVTFEQLEREYGAFVSRSAALNQPLAVASDRHVLGVAFDRLLASGLFVSAGSLPDCTASAAALGVQRAPVVLGLCATELRHALERSPNLSTELRQFVQTVNLSLA